MKFNKYLYINFLLSIIGIYLTYFYFGTQNYFYPIYTIFEIYKSTILISLILISLILIINFIFKFFFSSYLFKIFQLILFSTTFFFIFFYLLRFSDINYETIFITYFIKQNLIFKIIYYSLPFLISLTLSFFLNKNLIYKFNKFFFILLIIFNTLSMIRINNLYNNEDIQFNQKNDYKNFKLDIPTNTKIKKKVFFLVFDEFDQFFFEKNLNNLTNLKKIYKTSYVNKNFYAPAMYTIDSMPAILTGNSIEKKLFKDNNLYFYNLDNKLIEFNFKNSIFNKKKNKKITSSIYGVYHPYCRIFNVINCYDSINFSKKKINIEKSFQYFFHVTFLDKLYYLYEKKLKDKTIKINKPEESLLSQIMFKNSANFINSNTNLIFIHYDYPHPPLKIKDLIKIDKKKMKGLNDYEKNLFIVDKTISNIESSINNHKNALLIITTDHWFKGHANDKAYPGVFFSKIIGDNEYIEGKKNNNASSIKNLIDNYFNGNILNNNDINIFFNNNENHETYRR